VARRPTTPSGRVSYTLTLALARDLAERLTARAIREVSTVAQGEPPRVAHGEPV
jgi:hypothetical protein